MTTPLNETPETLSEQPKRTVPSLEELLGMRLQHAEQLESGVDIYRSMHRDLDEVLDEYKYDLMSALDGQEPDAILSADQCIVDAMDALLAIELLSDPRKSWSSEHELRRAMTKMKLERATRAIQQQSS